MFHNFLGHPSRSIRHDNHDAVLKTNHLVPSLSELENSWNPVVGLKSHCNWMLLGWWVVCVHVTCMHEYVKVWCSTFKKPVIGAGAGTLLLEKAPSAPLSLWSTRSCCWWLMELDGKRKDYGHHVNDWWNLTAHKHFEDFMKICTSTSSSQSGVNASVSLQRPQADWKGISTSSTWGYVTISNLLKFHHLRHKVITTSCTAVNLIVLLTERGKPWIWTRRWTEAISDSLSIVLSHDWRVWIRSAFSSQRSQLSQPKLQVTARPEDLESNAGSRRSTQSKASRASRASKGSNASRRVLALTAGCLFDLFCTASSFWLVFAGFSPPLCGWRLVGTHDPCMGIQTDRMWTRWIPLEVVYPF